MTAGINLFIFWKKSKAANNDPEQIKQGLLHQLREETLKLFLYAEKNDWVGEGEDKKQWAIQELYKKIPEPFKSVLESIIGPLTLDQWVENLYNEFKKDLQEKLDEDHKKEEELLKEQAI
jgi:hypothetical protein